MVFSGYHPAPSQPDLWMGKRSADPDLRTKYQLAYLLYIASCL
jgi:hypothetical protein